ncbi:cysteine synthase A [Desulfobacter postgatei]|uniref:cysteine synthase A n=1 Tax=Desulfobacter postgatei TaxID=2293 RepID=UPI00259B8936|nr:cysteine synthase A [uncultured Desulfobacter sp.]
MKAINDITQACGNIPLVYLERLSRECGAHLYAKLEYFNPLGSVKDRVGLAMIEAGIKSGQIGPDTLIVEPTSGNTCIALAFVARIKGLTIALTMPETMSLERQKLLRHLGPQLILTPGHLGMQGAVDKAIEMAATRDKAYMPDQFSNPPNPAAHRGTTGPEIWEATQGRVDIFVAGVGTGGTLTGVTEYIKDKKPDLMFVAVEPAESPVLSGGKAAPHPIQGIGAGFVPANLNREIVDHIFPVKGEDAMNGARTLAKSCAILCGISSGANFHAAFQIGLQHPGKAIVFIVCDTGGRYISTNLFESNHSPPPPLLSFEQSIC